MNPFNPARRRGKKLPTVTPRLYPSGHNARHEQHEGIKTNTAVVADDLARNWELSPLRETVATHLIPRHSLSADQLLGMKRPDFEEVALLGERHLLNASTGEMSERVENPHWKPVTPRSLLRQGKPDDWSGKRRVYTRDTARTHRREYRLEPEVPDDGINGITVIDGNEVDNMLATDDLHHPEPPTPETFERCKVCERSKIVDRPCPFHPTVTAA